MRQRRRPELCQRLGTGRRSDVVILVLTERPQVEAVLTGPDVPQGLRPGTIVIDCSTSILATTVRAQAVQARGGRLPRHADDAHPSEAAEGRLNLLVGGDAALLEECRPPAACFAENIMHVGDDGAGHSMKLRTTTCGGHGVAAGRSGGLRAHSGVAPDVFVDVLAKGGGGGAALERLRPGLLAHDPQAALLDRQCLQGPGLLQRHGQRRRRRQGNRGCGAGHARFGLGAGDQASMGAGLGILRLRVQQEAGRYSSRLPPSGGGLGWGRFVRFSAKQTSSCHERRRRSKRLLLTPALSQQEREKQSFCRPGFYALGSVTPCCPWYLPVLVADLADLVALKNSIWAQPRSRRSWPAAAWCC